MEYTSSSLQAFYATFSWQDLTKSQRYKHVMLPRAVLQLAVVYLERQIRRSTITIP